MEHRVIKDKNLIEYRENNFEIQFEFNGDLQKKCLINNLAHCANLSEILAISTEIHGICTVCGDQIDWVNAQLRLLTLKNLSASLGSIGQANLKVKVLPLLQRLADGEKSDELYYMIMALEPYA